MYLFHSMPYEHGVQNQKSHDVLCYLLLKFPYLSECPCGSCSRSALVEGG